MNWKLFASTFLMIFLAELGDKTQLAAMAQAATGANARWIVFSSATLALALSTLIAVLFGGELTKYVPERVIKGVAGLLFVVFGVLILFQVFVRARPAEAAAAPEAEARPGLFARVAMQAAAAFEEAASRDYAALARAAPDPSTARLLERLAAEEAAHLDRLRHAESLYGAHPMAAAAAEAFADRSALTHDVATGPAGDILRHAIEHEEASARFYAELARVATLPALRTAFGDLAAEEVSHAVRLRESLGGAGVHGGGQA
jgi:rubrerythrin